tara:strand:+ start:5295 stop:5735 length:441 start_codon:yes stop_codon:yes gene_type:complete
MHKYMMMSLLLALAIPSLTSAQSINFGDDASQWARDGRCDDRRFRGAGMAIGLDRDDVGHDATDCRNGVDAARLTVWDFAKAQAATECAAIDFGDDSNEWSHDGQCDDYRFDGPGADHVLLREDQGHDATDCRALCDLEQVALRDY